MVEGGSSRDFARAKALAYGDPQALHRLLGEARARDDRVPECADRRRRTGGHDLRHLGRRRCRRRPIGEFSLAYMEQIVADLIREREGRRVPVDPVHEGRRRLARAPVGVAGADALGVDWMTELSAARRDTFGRVALQGNLDPGVLFAPPAAIRAEVARVLESYGRGPGHVFNLGHGIQPGVDPEHVAAMVAASRSCRRRITARRGRSLLRESVKVNVPFSAVRRAACGAGSCRRWSSAARSGNRRAWGPCTA